MARGYYKEDSTRGKAMVLPRTYKGDSYVQVWLDRRKLAVLSLWLDRNEMRTRFMSDVVRMALDQLYEHLISSGTMNEMSTVAAGNLLEMKYKVDLNPRGRGHRNLLHNMVLSENVEERSRIVDSDTCVQNQVEDNEDGPPIGSPERVAWIRSLMNKARGDKSEVVVATRINPDDMNKSAKELYPDLVLSIPSKEEMEAQKERKRLAEENMAKARENRRLEELAKKQEEKEAIKEEKRKRKEAEKAAEEEKKLLEKLEEIRRKKNTTIAKDIDDDTPREKTPEEWREWEEKEKRELDKLSGDWGSPDPEKLIK